MRISRQISVVCILVTTTLAFAQTRPGIETLRDSDFSVLAGKRVGLITNATGVDNALRSTADILNEAANVELVALFGPEHGIRGDVHAGDKVGNATDPVTGLPVYSLYGKTRKPTSAMLAGIDALVYDIQDIGCRSYTFISTMALAMEACAEQGKEFIVLDRPNPLTGNKVEGCLVSEGFYSFVSQLPIPYVYGLTPGELATYLNEEGLLKGGVKVRLTVVPMKGWKRDMTFAQTGMPWVPPTPHIPSPDAAILYPATGILGELYAVSIGVGYTMPFQLVCAQWADAELMAKRMNELQLPGVTFRPIHIKPFYETLKDSQIDLMTDQHGVQIYITDIASCQLTTIQFYAMEVLADLYPDKRVFSLPGVNRRTSMFDKVCGSDQIRLRFIKNYRVADMIDFWDKDAQAFKDRSSKYYLYD